MGQGKESKIDLDKVVAWIMSLGIKRALIGAFGVFVMVTAAGMAGVRAYGKAMAGEFAQELVRPVTHALEVRVSGHDTVLYHLIKIVKEQAKLQEVTISAQRQTFPRYDSALRRIAEDREADRRSKIDNQELIRRLTESTLTH